MEPYRTSRPTLKFQLCCSLVMWLWDVIWLPESIYYLKNACMTHFWSISKCDIRIEWSQVSLPASAWPRTHQTQLIHICYISAHLGSKASFLQFLSSLCFKVGESAQLSTSQGKFPLFSLNPSIPPEGQWALLGSTTAHYFVPWVNTCCACWGRQPCLLRVSNYFLILQTH